MNLKPLVNDKVLYEDFLAELESRIQAVYRKMEQLSKAEDLYRCQGEIASLKSLKMLREKVNYE